MAGSIVYNGKMFQAMIEKLDQTITALNNVNTAASQGITKLNVKPGTGKVIQSVNPAISASMTGSGGLNTNTGIKFTSICDGLVTVKATLSASKANYDTYSLGIAKNGGGAVAFIIPNQTAVTQYTTTLAVKSGDIFEFWLGGSTSFYCRLEANGISISYDLVDLANQGAIVFNS